MAGIIVVFPKKEDSLAIKNLLVRNGFNAVACCTSGAQAISRADDLEEGIIISGYRLTDMTYEDILESVEGRFEMVLIASHKRLEMDEVSVSTLTMPIKVRDLLNTVEMMEHNILSRRHKKKRNLHQRNPEEQAVIEQAKAVLMEKNNMTEQEAHRYIQKTSMDSGNNMVETAKIVLTIMYKE
ncbi:MAG: ANTAR domain-containing protein [Lachnospiraceae bacterium]|nr:ANTAR domain-containing protein [Lachnospiraceae bacterium]